MASHHNLPISQPIIPPLTIPPLAIPPNFVAKKEVILTLEQAKLVNNKVQKGYAYVPVLPHQQQEQSPVVEGKRARKPPVRNDSFLFDESKMKTPKHSATYAPLTPASGKTKQPRSAKSSSKTKTKTNGNGTPTRRGRPKTVAVEAPAMVATTSTGTPGVPDESIEIMKQKLRLLEERLKAVESQKSTPVYETPKPAANKGRGKKRGRASLGSAAVTPSPSGAAPTPKAGRKPKINTPAPIIIAPAASPMSASAPTTPQTSRSNRQIKPPRFYEIESSQPQVKLSDSLRRCRDLITSLMGHRFAPLFSEPVDPVKFNIPDYFAVVKHPMDLGTIKHKLGSGYYANIDQFAQDIRLVWKNATSYNPPHDQVHKMALTMSETFESKFAKIILAAETAAANAAAAAAAPIRTPTAPKPKTKPLSRSNSVEKNGGGANTLVQLKNLQQQFEVMKKTLRQYSSKPKKVLDTTPLSYHEKQQLRENICKLPGEKLAQVIRIIRQHIPTKSQDDEIEIDIDQMDIPTLRELQSFVKTAVSSLKKTKKPRRKKTPATNSLKASPTNNTQNPSGVSASPSAPSLQTTATVPASLGPVPLGGQRRDQDVSSSSDSSGSDSSDDEKHDPAHPAKKQSQGEANKKPTHQQHQQEHKKMPQRSPISAEKPSFGDPSLFSATLPSDSIPAPAKPSKSPPADVIDTEMKLVDWSDLKESLQEEQAPVPRPRPDGSSSRSPSSSTDRLWSDFQTREVELKQKAKQKEELEERKRLARQQHEESLRREAANRLRNEREEEEERVKQEAEQAKERKKAIEAERETARRAREDAVPAVDLDAQKSFMRNIEKIVMPNQH